MTNEVTGSGRTKKEALADLTEAAKKYAGGREYELTPRNPKSFGENGDYVVYNGTVKLL